MNTLERIQCLNKLLLEEMPQYKADAATFPDKTHAQRQLLRSLMNLRHPGPKSCLDLAAQHHLKSIAFCCISTGEFHYPRKEAAEIALNAVSKWLASSGSEMKVIFNIFKDEDLDVYRKLLKF